MVDYEALKKLALECGFDHVGDLKSDTITVREEVRSQCAANTCQAYGTNWVCPPACGTIEECGAHIAQFKQGLIIQSTCELEDSFDFEAMMELAERHGASFDKFADLVREQYPKALVLGDGACKRCKKCTYPDEPCRFPERKSSAMEAYGMVVSEVCQKNDVPYYYGPGTLTYVGCILVE